MWCSVWKRMESLRSRSEGPSPLSYPRQGAEVFTIAWYGRHGSLRRLGHAGRAVGTLTPGTTGSTRLEGIDFEMATDTVAVPVGTGWANAHTGCVPLGAEIVTRMREPAR